MTHALLSASSAYRWLACPASVLREAEVKDIPTPDAKEGTRAHTAAAQALKSYLKSGKPSLPQDLEPEMVEAVTTYTEYVVKRYETLKATGEELVELYVEQRVDFSEWVPDGCGTADAYIICGGGDIEVFDFKYGVGTPVYAKSNPQLQLYALGVFSEHAGFDIVEDGSATMVIIQPRLPGGPIIDTTTEGFGNLCEWAETVAAPAAKAALAGQGVKAGAHCKYCKAAPTCLTWLKYTLELCETKPEPAVNYNMAAVLTAIPAIKKCLKSLEDHAYREALKGKAWPGLKLIKGQGRRVIADPEKLAKVLLDAGYQENTIYKGKARELKGISDLEKAITKKCFAELAEGCLSVAQRAPKLVPDIDPRPAYTPEQADYDKILKQFEEEED